MTITSKRIMISILLILSFLSLAGSPTYADSFENTVMPAVTGKLLYTQPDGEPDNQWELSYTTIVRLQYSGSANGRLIATFRDLYNPNGNPVYQSNDDGLSWTRISYLKQTQRGSQYVTWDPRFFELPQACGGLPAGTLLAAVRSYGLPSGGYYDPSLELYYSTNQGASWTFRGQIHYYAQWRNWEPHLALASNGNLVCYWACEESTIVPAGDQALVHKVSTDGGQTWGSIVTDVKVAGKRPGMPYVLKMPNGTYRMVFEVVNDAASKVHIKTSSDGLNWGTQTDLGPAVATPSGAYAGACPQMTWVPAAGGNGQLVVSSMFLVNSPLTNRQLFVSNNLGTSWHLIPAPVQWQGSATIDQEQGYSICMCPNKNGQGVVMLSTSFLELGRNEVRVGTTSVYNPTNIVSGMAYTLTNQLSSLNLDNANGAYADGNTVWQYPVNGDGAQMWAFVYAANSGGVNYYNIVNVRGSNPTYPQWGALQVKDHSLADGAQVYLKPLSSQTLSQQWQVSANSDGTVKIKNRNSSKILEMGALADIQAQAKQWADVNTPTQKWYLTPVVPSGMMFTVKNNYASSLAMEVSNWSQNNSAQVWLWQYYPQGNANQIWSAHALSNGSTQLLAMHSGKALDNGGTTAVGSYPVQYTWSTTNSNQMWYIQPFIGVNPVRYSIVPFNNTGVCLEDKNSGTSDGTPIQLNNATGSSIQKWDFMDVTP